MRLVMAAALTDLWKIVKAFYVRPGTR